MSLEPFFQPTTYASVRGKEVGGHLLHSINQRINYRYFSCAGIYYTDRQLFRSLITQLPCGCIFKAISPLPFCCRPLSVRLDHWRIFDSYCTCAQSLREAYCMWLALLAHALLPRGCLLSPR